MSKAKKDYKVILSKLHKKNQEYRDELKSLSSQLDQVLKKNQQDIKRVESPNPQVTIETLNKKISILENEIRRLKAKSPQPVDRLSLENQIQSLKDTIKTRQASNKELQKMIDEGNKKEKKENSNNKFADLKTVRQKLKKIEEKYALENKNHEKNLQVIAELEEQLGKLQENHIDILVINSYNLSRAGYEIADLKIQLSELENQRKMQEAQFKPENETLQSAIKVYDGILVDLRKELKLRVHEVNTKDHEINELKRKLRSSSTRRFNNSPDIGH